MLEYVLVGILIISLFILLVYQIYFFKKLMFFKNEDSHFNDAVSIIICAKNEVKNLRDNLPKVLSQEYSEFEVIVVNDQSTDGTAKLLKEFDVNHPNLVVVTIDEHINHRPGKKFALTLGIKTAKYEHVLLSDADCYPSSKRWLKQMVSNFSDKDIVLGYGAYEKERGLLNKIIRFDTFNVAQQYLSYALAKQTYMGVGRNLAYKKSIFFKNKGFANHLHIPSGDDDLFIQEVATSNNVAIEVNNKAHTISEVNKKWKDWIYQKRRHISTASHYKFKFKVLLTLYPYAQLLFWVALFSLLLLNIQIPLVLLLLVIKIISSYVVNYKVMKGLSVLDLYWIHPLYEILLLVIQGIFVLLNFLQKPKQWNR